MMKKQIAALFLLVFLGFVKNVEAQTPNGTITFDGTSNTNVTLCEGSSGFMTLSGHTGSIVNWVYSFSGASGPYFPAVPVNNTTTYPYFSVTSNVCYKVVLNGGSDSSNPACITVDPTTLPGTITGANAAACGSVGPGTLTVSGYNGNGLGWVVSLGGGPFSSTGNVTTTQTHGTLTQTAIYGYVNQSGVCPKDTAFDTVQVIPSSFAGNFNQNSYTACSTTNGFTIVSTGIVGTIIGWQESTSAGGPYTPISGATNSSYTFSNIATTMYYQLVVQNSTCPQATSTTFTANVGSPPVAGTISGGTSGCGTPQSGSLTLSGHSGNVVMWQSSTNGGATWTSIANTSTTQAFTNITQTTIYQAIIGTPGCSTVTATPDTVIYFANSNAGTINGAATVCEFLNFGTVNLTGFTGTSFQWQASTDGGATWNNVVGAGASTSYSNISVPTAYQCIVTNGFCTPITSNSVTINTQPGPTVSILTNDTSINPNTALNIIAISSATSYTWTPAASVSNPSILSPTVTPTVTTTYTLLVSSANGCLNMDTIRVTVRPSEFQGLISNMITPNSDGINDYWYIENIQAYKEVELKVFNEYGQLVYQSNDYKNDWAGTYNGSRLPDGTYYYVLEFKEFEQIVKGFITILSQ